MVLRVPLSACSKGTALTLKQVEVIGLSVGEAWTGARVNTSLVSLCTRCGWPSQVVSDCGSASKKGLVDTFREAPHATAWISDLTHVVANALQHSSADVSLLQQFQTLCPRMRGRLQHTRFAFVLPPKARTTGRLLHVSRQAEWGLRTMAYVEEKKRAPSPETSTLAQALRGLKPLKPFLTPFVRHTPCVNEGMKMVNTQGVSVESIQACQETLGD